MFMNDESWKDQYKEWKSLEPYQIELLENGAKSQSQAWLINSMWCDWRDIKKVKDTELPTIKYLDEDPWGAQN